MKTFLTSAELKAMIDEYTNSKPGETALERNILFLARQLLDLQTAAEEAWYADVDEVAEVGGGEDPLAVERDDEKMTPTLVLRASREIAEAMAAEWAGEVAGHC